MYAQENIKPYAGEGSKREQVERMFNGLAHSYDKLNHILSLGVDRWWRKRAIRFLKQYAQGKPDHVLDIATGTGDFALLAAQELNPKQVVGIDISEEMMAVGRQKIDQKGLSSIIQLKHEDCSRMSFSDNEFDAIISSFGLRNFQNLDDCLAEMRRVMKPDGVLVVIDLCTPVSFPMKQLFQLYRKAVMPWVGRLISHDDSAYTYLPDSMQAIPQGEDMTAIFRKAGFTQVAYKRMAFDLCIMYYAKKTDI